MLLNLANWLGFVLPFLMCGWFQGSFCVRIVNMSVPGWVLNGTEDSVILDCIYNYTKDEDGIVVKWFLNSDAKPIYQWISELGRRYWAPKIKRQVDPSYEVPNVDRFSRFRAFKVVRPTISVSGRYTCHVHTSEGEHMDFREMIVYSPPSRFDINVTRLPFGGLMISCEVEGVHPVPELTLLQSPLESKKPLPTSSPQSSSRLQDGTYSSSTWTVLSENDIQAMYLYDFICILHIPKTNITLTTAKEFYEWSFTNSASVTLPLRYLLFVSSVTVIICWVGHMFASNAQRNKYSSWGT